MKVIFSWQGRDEVDEIDTRWKRRQASRPHLDQLSIIHIILPFFSGLFLFFGNTEIGASVSKNQDVFPYSVPSLWVIVSGSAHPLSRV